MRGGASLSDNKNNEKILEYASTGVNTLAEEENKYYECYRKNILGIAGDFCVFTEGDAKLSEVTADVAVGGQFEGTSFGNYETQWQFYKEHLECVNLNSYIGGYYKNGGYKWKGKKKDELTCSTDGSCKGTYIGNHQYGQANLYINTSEESKNNVCTTDVNSNQCKINNQCYENFECNDEQCTYGKKYNAYNVKEVKYDFIDFEKEFQELRKLSKKLKDKGDEAGEEFKVTCKNESNGDRTFKYKMKEEGNTVIITVDAENFFSAECCEYFDIEGLNTSKFIIINVDCTEKLNSQCPKTPRTKIAGSTDSWNALTENILWNFYYPDSNNNNGNEVQLELNEMIGTILAPNIEVKINGNLDGSVIAKKIIEAQTINGINCGIKWRDIGEEEPKEDPKEDPKEEKETTSVYVEKNWIDKENEEGKRPENVKFKLLADNEEKGILTLSEKGKIVEFKDLQQKDEKDERDKKDEHNENDEKKSTKSMAYSDIRNRSIATVPQTNRSVDYYIELDITDVSSEWWQFSEQNVTFEITYSDGRTENKTVQAKTLTSWSYDSNFKITIPYGGSVTIKFDTTCINGTNSSKCYMASIETKTNTCGVGVNWITNCNWITIKMSKNECSCDKTISVSNGSLLDPEDGTEENNGDSTGSSSGESSETEGGNGQSNQENSEAGTEQGGSENGNTGGNDQDSQEGIGDSGEGQGGEGGENGGENDDSTKPNTPDNPKHDETLKEWSCKIINLPKYRENDKGNTEESQENKEKEEIVYTIEEVDIDENYTSEIEKIEDKAENANSEDKTEYAAKYKITNTLLNNETIEYNYKVEYYYDGEIDDEKTDTFTAKYGAKIIKYEDKVKTGYKLEKVEPTNVNGELELQITDNEESNVIKVYYVKDKFNYKVEYYYDGIIDPSKTETLEDEYEQEISTYKEKLEPGYVKVKEENLPLKISDDESKNVIKVYYRRQYNITTKVITHTETYSNGRVENVKGGSISGDSLDSYEKVLKGEDNTKAIVITPDKDYEIVNIWVTQKADLNNSQNSDEENPNVGNLQDRTDLINYNDYIENGVVTIPAGYFKKMQSDKHIEVEFRKKSKVIVKYLEKTEKGYTENELLPQDEIIGYEGKSYETARKNVLNYRAVEDQEKNIEPKNATGTMKANEITVIYYYEKIPAGVIVKYLEKVTKPNGEVNAIKIAGAEVEYIKGHIGEEFKTSRKEIENYVPAEPPQLDKDVKNVIYVNKDENMLNGKYKEDVTEIVYWYERQYHIFTKVKPIVNPEADPSAENPEEIYGGSISGGETPDVPYEDVLRSQDNKKEVEIVPEDGYRVKEVVINGESVDLSEFEKADGSVILPKGYFKDVQEDIIIEVEFERIPAILTIKYIDEHTGEEIIPSEQTNGFVNDEYITERKELENYIPSGEEPENAKGKLVKEGVIVIYYYIKQFKITTDVVEHYEFENREVIELPESNNNKDENNSLGGRTLVKGGKIFGEDEQHYELVNRGKHNTKEIQIVPDNGYMIKYVKLKQPGAEIEKLDLEELFAKPGIVEWKIDDNVDAEESDKSNNKQNNQDNNNANKQISYQNINLNRPITLEVGYFKDMQSDKHIEVEFERIPTKITVDYLNKDTQEKISKSEFAYGYVNDEYKTYEKEIPYYELVKDNYPENKEGKLAQDDTKVIYWYRRLLFNMKLTKELASVQVNGKEALGSNKKLMKIDIPNTEMQSTDIFVKYKIKVFNTEEVAGIAKVLERIPVGFKVSSQMQVIKAEDATSEQFDVWQEAGNNLELTTRELQPGETAEYEVILEWDTSKRIIGNLENVAKITETQNVPNFEETDQEDNRDSCTVLIAVRTGGKTKVSTIISISCFVLAGICSVGYIGIEVYYRRLSKTSL